MCCWQIFIFVMIMYGAPLLVTLTMWVGRLRRTALVYTSVVVAHVVVWVWLIPTINHPLITTWGFGLEAWTVILLGDTAVCRLEEGKSD